jgi:hypothetical protein
MNTPKVLLLAVTIVISTIAHSQTPVPYFTYGKGLGITSPDSLFFP